MIGRHRFPSADHTIAGPRSATGKEDDRGTEAVELEKNGTGLGSSRTS